MATKGSDSGEKLITSNKKALHDYFVVQKVEAGLALTGTEVKSLRDGAASLGNEAGQVALVYRLYRCWVSEYQALPDLDANANAVAIAQMKLEHEGWERDVEVTEPAEPTFTEPAV